MKKPRGLLLLLASDENNHSGMFSPDPNTFINVEDYRSNLLLHYYRHFYRRSMSQIFTFVLFLFEMVGSRNILGEQGLCIYKGKNTGAAFQAASVFFSLGKSPIPLKIRIWRYGAAHSSRTLYAARSIENTV